jgi:hypothetical protein
MSYRIVLVSTLLHAPVYIFLHNLLIVLVQIANKMGLQKKDLCTTTHMVVLQMVAVYCSLLKHIISLSHTTAKYFNC